MKFLRQLFDRDEKPEEILVPEAELLDEPDQLQVQAAVPAETDEDDEDTIVPAAPPSPDPDEESEITLAKDRPPVTKAGAPSIQVGYATHVGRVRNETRIRLW